MFAPVRVGLTEREFIRGFAGGCGRHACARFRKLRPNLGAFESLDQGIHSHAEAACAELAAGKFLGLPWEPRIGILGPGDLPGVEVKSSISPRASVWFRPKDPDLLPVVYVTGLDGSYLLHGWMTPAEAKRRVAYQASPANGKPGGWELPRAALRDIRALRAFLATIAVREPA